MELKLIVIAIRAPYAIASPEKKKREYVPSIFHI